MKDSSMTLPEKGATQQKRMAIGHFFIRLKQRTGVGSPNLGKAVTSVCE
jgi:hypothetical protein